MIDGAISLVEQSHVFRVPPACAVGPAGRVEKTEECERIHVICRPAGSRDTLVIQFRHRRKEGLPFHDPDRNGRSEGLLPLRLNKLGKCKIVSVWISDQLDFTSAKLLRIKSARRCRIT